MTFDQRLWRVREGLIQVSGQFTNQGERSEKNFYIIMPWIPGKATAFFPHLCITRKAKNIVRLRERSFYVLTFLFPGNFWKPTERVESC